MKAILEALQHIFTARDGVSYSLTKLVGLSAASAMIYKFVTVQSELPTDYSGFGTGIALLMAALAAKYMVEKE